jgi:hypothetical protein
VVRIPGRSGRLENATATGREDFHTMNKRNSGSVTVAIFWALLAAPSASGAAIFTVPPGLNPGDQYRVAFITSNVRDGTSANIADYDRFVSDDANAAGSILQPLGTTWQAIVSTLTVDAFTHIGGNFAMPVFDSTGRMIARNAGDLWDGSVDSPISLDRFGIGNAGFVNTGTDTNGAILFGLGELPFGGGPGGMTVGASGFIGPAWISGGTEGNIAMDQFYGISGVLTVASAAPAASAAPEPSSALLFGVGIAGIVLGSLSRGRRGGVAADERGSTPIRIRP